MTFSVITFSLKHRLERGSVGRLDTLCNFWLCIQWTQLGLVLAEVYERALMSAAVAGDLGSFSSTSSLICNLMAPEITLSSPQQPIPSTAKLISSGF